MQVHFRLTIRKACNGAWQHLSVLYSDIFPTMWRMLHFGRIPNSKSYTILWPSLIFLNSCTALFFQPPLHMCIRVEYSQLKLSSSCTMSVLSGPLAACSFAGWFQAVCPKSLNLCNSCNEEKHKKIRAMKKKHKNMCAMKKKRKKIHAMKKNIIWHIIWQFVHNIQF